MKQDIHPQYNKEATVQCACGNTFSVGSTQKDIEVEICSECHPFYTGKGKLVDSAGRIEKFKERMEKHEELKKKKETRKKKQEKKDSQTEPEEKEDDVPEQPENSNIRITK